MSLRVWNKSHSFLGLMAICPPVRHHRLNLNRSAQNAFLLPFDIIRVRSHDAVQTHWGIWPCEVAFLFAHHNFYEPKLPKLAAWFKLGLTINVKNEIVGKSFKYHEAHLMTLLRCNHSNSILIGLLLLLQKRLWTPTKTMKNVMSNNIHWARGTRHKLHQPPPRTPGCCFMMKAWHQPREMLSLHLRRLWK